MPVRVARTAAVLTLAVTAFTALVGCSATAASAPSTTVTVTATVTVTPTPSIAPAADATSSIAVARLLRDALPMVTKVVKLTEDNDPNDLIGRPSGYVSGAVLYDSRTACSDGLGTDCGATIEEWPSAADARARSKYIQNIYKSAPALGSEYDTISGPFLLRVTGDLKPSQSKAYSKAFSALLG